MLFISRVVLCSTFFGVMAFAPIASYAATTNIVDWEIRNRFTTFEIFNDTSRDAIAVFETYRVEKNETMEEWHERLAREFGANFQSPFAEVSPWIEQSQKHSDIVLDFIKGNPSIEILVSAKLDGDCTWSLAGTILEEAVCDEPRPVSIPLDGQTITVHNDFRSVTENIVPDHEIIVALGDSYGSGEGNPDGPTVWKANLTPKKGSYRWVKERISRERSATWVDHTCHRSFFSFQSLAALARASANPHKLVTFLHYSCTGAEIFDGLLYPQETPGGALQKGRLQNSQLNSAIIELCNGSVSPLGYTNKPPGGKSTENYSRDNGFSSSRDVLKCDGDFRRPDYVFLSIGGNDVGFADIIQYYVVPVDFWFRTATRYLLPEICPGRHNQYSEKAKGGRDAKKHCEEQKYTASYLANQIEDKYRFVFASLSNMLRVDENRIVIAQYPDPLRTSEEIADFCAALGDYGKSKVYGMRQGTYDPMGPWNAFAVEAIGVPTVRRWQFNITEDEAKLLLRQFSELRAGLVDSVKNYSTTAKKRPTLVCETRDAFLGNGWWLGEKLNFPTLTHDISDERWKPSEWEPYKFEKNGRAIRTANDSYLTQASDRNDFFYGTAHPNLRGHSLLAQRIIDTMQW